MSRLKFYFLGPPRLERDDVIEELGLRKAAALLAYLVITRQTHSRDALATLFWPESDQGRARASLRRTLYRLNQQLQEDVLQVTPETARRNPGADIWVDVEAFRDHVAACMPERGLAPTLSTTCLDRLSEAVELHQDDFLAGFTLPDSPEFDEWQFFEREALRQALVGVLMQLAETYQMSGAYDEAIAFSRRWLALDQLNEAAHRSLMRLYAWSDRQTAALRQYQECVRLLDEELGITPEAETSELYEAIRSKRLAPPEGTAPRGISESAAPPRPAGTATKGIARPETHYIRSGDVHIAYQVLGEGPVDVLFVNGFVSHLDQIWRDAEAAAFTQRLASFARVILFDKRGVGLSDRIGYPPCLDDTMDDMRAVLDAVGCDSAVLFGVSEGGPNSVLFAATHPDRVNALILYGTVAKFTRDDDYPWAPTRAQWEKWIDQIVNQWGAPVSLEFFAPSRAADPAFRTWWAETLRLASSPGGVRAVLEVARDIDVRHVLPAVHVPTLVLHRSGDRMMRVGGARYLAQQIPDANYVELAGEDHWWWVGDTESILAAVEAFVKGRSQPIPPELTLATILYITGSQGELDEVQHAWAGREIARFRGREIGERRGRVLATFDGPSRALQCAQAIREAGQSRGLPVRAALHTGECHFTNGDVRGLALDVAAGVLEVANPGEILVPRTVKDLVAGSGFRFVDRGVHWLPGIGDEWRLYAVS